MRETWDQSLGWEDPLEKEHLPSPVFWPGEFLGQHSPWVAKGWTQLSDLAAAAAANGTLLYFKPWADHGKGGVLRFS